jgi:predicted Zn-dependent peptidase
MSVRREKLNNGLTVLTENLLHLRSVALSVWIRQGSRHESETRSGISHFLEHLLFKGTKKRSARQLALDIDAIGGQMDAFTSREYVGFYVKALDSHLGEALDLLSEIVLQPSFPREEIDRERNVICEEISMTEDTPGDLVHDLFIENFWKHHPLGRSISGTKKIIRSLSRRILLSHFRKVYVPENIVVAATGRLDHHRIVDMVSDRFAALQGTAEGFQNEAPKPFRHNKVRHKPNLEQTHICIGTVCPPVTSSRRFTAVVLSTILGGNLSSRLFQKIREKHWLAYNVYSSLNMHHDAGMLLIYAATGRATAHRVVDMIVEECRNIRKDSVTANELKHAKENIKGSLVLSLESSSSRMMQMAQQEIYFQHQYPIGEILASLDRVTCEGVWELAQEIFDNRYLSLALIGDLGKDRTFSLNMNH